MDLKTGESGLGIFKANPSKSTFPELQHQSYNTAIPGEYFGGLTASVPPEIMFPKAFSAMSKNKQWRSAFSIFKSSWVISYEPKAF